MAYSQSLQIKCFSFAIEKAAFDITRNVSGGSVGGIKKSEAVVYVMADKFLDQLDMEEIKEGIRMTRLGQMMVELGRDEGIQIGEESVNRSHHLKSHSAR